MCWVCEESQKRMTFVYRKGKTSTPFIGIVLSLESQGESQTGREAKSVTQRLRALHIHSPICFSQQPIEETESQSFSEVAHAGSGEAQLLLEPTSEGFQSFCCGPLCCNHSGPYKTSNGSVRSAKRFSDHRHLICPQTIFIFPDRSRIDSSQRKSRGHPADSQCQFWICRRGPT